ncbi:MAG TPA: hypothetical protein VF570_17290, partial [Pyrinomonadaceae bacterium]
NKADLLAPDDLDALLRQACAVGGRECIAVSALKPETLRPLLERAGAILARDLTHDEGAARAGAGNADAGDDTESTPDGSPDGDDAGRASEAAAS